ncbi:DUF2637 domain-containing protein [Actinomadura coerulea]|uniref:DUF2637 domain-containing protein n=1 Tax=Actinomadura coerulea TaxID=46159 RepID=UPI0016153494|nr:DUF2637 domain-containing protein [Actinomadura coerulea]
MNTDQIRSAERALSAGTWLIVFGAMLYSVLTVTPLMRAHTPDRWDWTAPILPLVVDAAVVIVVRLDSVLARLGQDGGRWPAALRWMTGTMTLSLNIAESALDRDMVGVAVHAVAPLLLIVTAETGLAYRRAITKALTAREHAAAERLEAERQRAREERERQAQLAREEREHEAAMARQEAERRERAEREERQRAEAAERERRGERERADQERERAERERQRQQAEAERREREREHARREAERQRAEAAERERRALLAAGPAPHKLPQPQARQIVAAAFAAGLSVRDAAERCGWSIGWVAGRYQELRDSPADQPAAV